MQYESKFLIDRRRKMMGFGVETDEKKSERIKPLSEKRKKLQREYRKMVKTMLSENNKCQVQAPGCSHMAQGLHHIVKRSPANITDKENLIPCCNKCNLWIEENSQLAMALGFVKSKFKK